MTRKAVLFWVAVSAVASVAVAQTAPFFGSGTVAFEPEIGFVHTGIMQEAQGVVSPDRKYVSIGVQATAQRVLAFDEFNFQRSGAMGVVGQVGTPGHAPSVLDREGITRLDP